VVDWYDIRQQARRDVHVAFAVEASYTDSTVVVPVVLSVRWQQRFGAPIGAISRDYAGVFETIDRVIFNTDELRDRGLIPKRGGELYFTKYDRTLKLQVQEPSSGPVEECWTVST
jgi:hypothetical protein